MEINIPKLEKVTNMLFDHLRQSNIQDVDMDVDFYWHIPEEIIYDLKSEPKEYVVGQLSDDWAELQEILEGDKDVLAYDLVKLSAIFRVIGERVVT